MFLNKIYSKVRISKNLMQGDILSPLIRNFA